MVGLSNSYQIIHLNSIFDASSCIPSISFEQFKYLDELFTLVEMF